MPWNECRQVEERLRFIARLLDGEKMAGLYREFGMDPLKMARPRGFEPLTPRLGIWCSIQLSYGRFEEWNSIKACTPH